MDAQRRSFLKNTCIKSAALCVACTQIKESAAETSVSPAPAETTIPTLQDNWLKSLLTEVDQLPEKEKRQLVKGCSQAHYKELKMDSLLAQFKGKPQAFFEFLQNDWGWEIDYQPELKRLIADENKPHCVCPLKQSLKPAPASLCYCSEGFAERMFSYVFDCSVSAVVTASVIRGDSSCIYEVQLPECYLG